MHEEECVRVAVSRRVSENKRKYKCVHKKACVWYVCVCEHDRTSMGRYMYESVHTGTDMNVCMCVCVRMPMRRCVWRKSVWFRYAYKCIYQSRDALDPEDSCVRS